MKQASKKTSITGLAVFLAVAILVSSLLLGFLVFFNESWTRRYRCRTYADLLPEQGIFEAKEIFMWYDFASNTGEMEYGGKVYPIQMSYSYGTICDITILDLSFPQGRPSICASANLYKGEIILYDIIDQTKTPVKDFSTSKITLTSQKTETKGKN